MKSTTKAIFTVAAAIAAVAISAAVQAAPMHGHCASANWYLLGERDGETNSNRIARYTAQCAAVGVQPDGARYAEGRVRGLWVRQRDHLLYTPQPRA